MQQRFIPLL